MGRRSTGGSRMRCVASRPDVADAIVDVADRRSAPPRARWRSPSFTRLTPPGARAPTRWSRHSALRWRPPSSPCSTIRTMRTSARALVPLMCEHGRLLAPTLASRLGQVRRRRRTRDHQGDRLCRLRLRERARRSARARRRADREGSGAGVDAYRQQPRGRDRRRAPAAKGTAQCAPPPRRRCGTFRRPPRTWRCAICSATASSCCSIRRSPVRLIDRAEQAGTTNLEPALRALMPLRVPLLEPGARPRRAPGGHARRDGDDRVNRHAADRTGRAAGSGQRPEGFRQPAAAAWARIRRVTR